MPLVIVATTTGSPVPAILAEGTAVPAIAGVEVAIPEKMGARLTTIACT